MLLNSPENTDIIRLFLRNKIKILDIYTGRVHRKKNLEIGVAGASLYAPLYFATNGQYNISVPTNESDAYKFICYN